MYAPSMKLTFFYIILQVDEKFFSTEHQKKLNTSLERLTLTKILIASKLIIYGYRKAIVLLNKKVVGAKKEKNAVNQSAQSAS